ncbi:unnamed protein product [Cladocopium goreaui]|uniref:ARM REPEAT PROTEIN INTERACTING WITH ABF2 (ARIA) n=1 Tax=Cladocopium goreaui TaxID=2562237 RepID=A0A9P1FIB4_9DINO|nr:unnamed protein product [Cladocopium goreaui]
MFEGRETSLQETHQFPAATAVPRPQQVDDVECKSAINQWSIVKPFGGCQPPKQRSLHASIVVGDCLYIFGGCPEDSVPVPQYDGSSRVNDFYKFSFKASKWSQIHTTGAGPTARDRHVVVSFTDKIYIFAGYDGNNRVNDFWQYDTEHEAWQMVDAALGNPPTPRHSHSGVEYDGSMYIFAGYDGNYRSDFHRYNFPQRKWSIVPVKGSVPKARYRTSAVAYKNRMLVVGGHDGAKHLNDFYQFNFDSLECRSLAVESTKFLGPGSKFKGVPAQRRAGVAEALLQNQRFMARVDAVHGCSGGALVGALMLTGAEGLKKVKAYLESGLAFRSLTLAELWDPARLIPRAVEESGAMPMDAFWQLSGRLHVQCTKGGMFRNSEPVTYSSFDSNEELVRILQASSSFAYEGVEVRGEPHWDGGITEILPQPLREDSQRETTVTVAPVCARHVSICPQPGVCLRITDGLWAFPGSMGRGWRHGWRHASKDCTFMFSPQRMMKYWAAGRADGAFLRTHGYTEFSDEQIRDALGRLSKATKQMQLWKPYLLGSLWDSKPWRLRQCCDREMSATGGAWLRPLVKSHLLRPGIPIPSAAETFETSRVTWSVQAVICGDSMYLFGGSTGSARNDLYAFSFETEQWLEVRPTPGASQKANVPCPRFCHTCDVYNNSLYVFGGYDGQQRLNDFWQFKLATEVNIDIPNSSLVSDLRDFLNDAKLSDVTFIVEGKAVYAHKLLCMRCSYFRAMFDGQMREAQQKTITINNVSHRVFLALLEYLYTDEFEISMEIAMDLFVAADQFGIERLKRLCEKKILVSINIDSAATILQAANMHIANDLRQSCMDFILRNFDAVSKTPAFEEMGRSNVELVFEILKRR